MSMWDASHESQAAAMRRKYSQRGYGRWHSTAKRQTEKERVLNLPLAECPVWRRYACGSIPYLMTSAELLEGFARLFGEQYR